MSKKSRGHQPPRQAFNQPTVVPGGVPIVDPNRQSSQEQAYQQQIKAKVESLAATLFTNSFDVNAPSTQDFERACEETGGRCIDASLIMAKLLWGIEGRRNKVTLKPNAPKILEDRPAVEEDEQIPFAPVRDTQES